MADNRADVAIATTEAIASLILSEIDAFDEDKKPAVAGLKKAKTIVETFIAALRIQQASRRGRRRGEWFDELDVKEKASRETGA